jgi:hypothetical protein
MDESPTGPTNAADELVTSAAHLPEHVADPCGRAKAIEALRRGPHGAVAVASIAVLCVLIIWYAFYLFAYLPRT